MTPTLVMHRVTDLPDDVVADKERLRYLPPGTEESWKAQLAEIFTKGRTPEQAAQHRRIYRHRLRILNDMHRAGVPILAGTDAPVMYLNPGFALHDELAQLVAAGLTPMAALQAATREPARYLGLADSLGTIRKGYLADLVVLDANPLDDIRNTLRIHSVMTRGRYLSAADRVRLLASIEAAAKAVPSGGGAIGCCG
ncbi:MULTISPECIES: amidohydrolase family protein [unclassified Nonomuraea]|uniref:amidohydrolase family protein n=1 Tax=unclassified Nonomuraea TaxID=2593643 RepID=UPI0033D2B662